jgi:hypothetical protein
MACRPPESFGFLSRESGRGHDRIYAGPGRDTADPGGGLDARRWSGDDIVIYCETKF